MAITPSSDLKLLKCPIELDNKNQLTFDNATAQYNYFNSLEKKEVDGFTYLRQNNVIRYNAHLDTLLEYNYIMYRNENYSNKWFYAFITRMEYVSDTVTNIYIDTDYYQTWMFDLTFMKSFVEREHVADDTVGKHTFDEGLSTGDYLQVTAPVDINSFTSDNMAVCVCVTQMPDGSNISAQRSINGIYSGLICAVFSHSNGLATECEWANSFINLYDQNAKATAITSIFMVPKAMVLTTQHMAVKGGWNPDHTDWFFYYPTTFDSYVDITGDVTVSMPSNLAENYSPVNNKLKTFPYNYLLVTNNAGIDTIFHYEDFSSNTPVFKVIGDITPGCSIKCIPINYLKQTDNNTFKSFNYGIAGGKLPICAWANDAYTNWLAENGVSMSISGVSGALSVGIGIAALAGAPLTGGISTLAAGGMIAGGAGMIANTLNENRKASLMPDQSNGNMSAGDITYSAGKSGFTAYKLSIRKERAKAIDDYFSMFGYKVNTLKVPELHSRSKWNYIKTIDINITAYIPQDDLQKIKEMFNNGITLWHDSAHFLDYSQSNPIVV